MRIALALLLLSLVACACGAARAGQTVTKPRLALMSVAPVTVFGTGFRVGEKVRLLVSGDVTARKTVVANARGRFTARFAVSGDSCTAVVVQAIGSRGSRARVSMDAPACEPIGP